MATTTGGTLRADLLVIGAGMAGLSAGARAARKGASVVVLEKGAEIGGSAALSGGYLWTAPSFEALRERNPLGDPRLGSMLVERFPAALEWVRSFGIQFSDPVTIHGWGRGYLIDILGYLQRCCAAIESAGGWVVRSCRVERLLVEGRRVIGCDVVDRDGQSRVLAPATLLATGGFQGDAARRAMHIHPNAERMLVRSNPHSTGDGLRLGQAAGAAITAEMGGFYGHLVCRPVHRFTPSEFIRLTQYYSQYGLLLNATGERFTDESSGDHSSAPAVIRQPGGKSLVVVDQYVRRTWATSPAEPGMEEVDKIAEAEAAGANVARADTLEGLADHVTGWGFDRKGVLSSMRRYNEWCRDGAGEICPPRAADRIPLVEPPYYAVEVQAAVTFTYGGLRIDEWARVLDGAGAPIPGLHAAGADAGGVYVTGYAGGLSLGLVFGLEAAASATGKEGDRFRGAACG